MIRVEDDMGRTVELPQAPSRIVSLVPSLTETLFALGAGDSVVGVTRFCEEPAAEMATRTKVGGTKNPDCELIGSLAPELVIVNAEENRRVDFDRLVAMGLTVLVTFPATVAATVGLLRQLGEVTGCEARGHALAAELDAALRDVSAHVGERRRVFCPIWKNPWMTVGGGTYADDMLWTAGGVNVFRDDATPYPETTLDDVARREPEVVLLPDEPYRFAARDLADLAELRATPAGIDQRLYLIDGKALSWYGPRAAGGLRTIAALLR